MTDLTDLPDSGSLTIEDAIRHTATCFERAGVSFGHGTDSALDEASWLILHSLGLSPLVAPDYARALGVEERQACNQAIEARINTRMPTAYLTGSAWFAGLEFRCDPRALVPRSPLAEWILADFYGLVPSPVNRVLDLCTGGGCIGIACAVALPHARVVGSDLSADALALAQENVALHQLEDRVTLVQSDLFQSLDGRFDLIVSNPPYVDAADLSRMPTEYHHEPAMGLGAGPDGLDLVRIILREAPRYLNDRGVLVVEVGNSADAVEATWPDTPFLWLEFSSGGAGVFCVTVDELRQMSW